MVATRCEFAGALFVSSPRHRPALRALRRSSARAALAPLQPELEAFSLSFSRYREAADLYRELKIGEKEGGG